MIFRFTGEMLPYACEDHNFANYHDCNKVIVDLLLIGSADVGYNLSFRTPSLPPPSAFGSSFLSLPGPYSSRAMAKETSVPDCAGLVPSTRELFTAPTHNPT